MPTWLLLRPETVAITKDIRHGSVEKHVKWWNACVVEGGKGSYAPVQGEVSVCVCGGCRSVYLHECMCEHACGMCVCVGSMLFVRSFMCKQAREVL